MNFSPKKGLAWHFPFTEEICRTTLRDSESVLPDGEQFGHCSWAGQLNVAHSMVFSKRVTFSDFITAKCDKGVFEDSCWIVMYFIELHMLLHIVLTFSSKKTGQWSIVTPVTQWDLVQAEPKLRDKWPNCQVAFTLHCTKYTNTNSNTQIHKYTNTAYDEMPERPNMWYIFEKRIVQGYQKLYSHVSNAQMQNKVPDSICSIFLKR